MEKTTNYGLNKPDGIEIYDVTQFNENMDIIDEALNNAGQSTSDEINSKIGTTEDTGATEANGSVMGKLNFLLTKKSGIKSIQRGSGTASSSTETPSVNISYSAIDTAKSIVILNASSRIYNTENAPRVGVYLQSFGTNSMWISTTGFPVNVTFSWQVIEFY